MAKKDKKKKDKGSSNPADAVRGAVEQAATRFRDTLDDLRLPEELRGLRTEIEALSRRVAALEAREATPPAPAKAAPKPRARRTTPARASAGTKPAGTKRPSASTGTKRPSTRSTGTARKPAASRSRAKPEDPAPEASPGRS